jgi:hypothetical protein
MIKIGFGVYKTAFSDVYGPNYTPTNFTAPEYTDRRIETSQLNVYVYNCLFRDLISSSSNGGGALYCSSSGCRLLVEQSSFIYCFTSSGNGGGIHIDATESGECVLSRICGFNCLSPNSGQFARIYANNNKVNNKNHVNDSSITHSLNENTNTHYTLLLGYGSVLSRSVNLTNNKCFYFTALYYYQTYDTCYISYSTITNNTANGYTCIYLNNPSYSCRIETCNILNNNQNLSNYGIIRVYSNSLIQNSCILGNDKGKIVFYHETTSSYTLISNCTIDDDIFTGGRYYGSVTVIKAIESTFINALSHIATHKCDSYFDSYETLSVKISVPSQFPVYLRSCNCYRPMNDLLSSMQFTFLLTMLPSC